MSAGRKDAGPGVYFVSPTATHRFTSSPKVDEPAAVCPQCGCTFGVGRSTLRPHHASATGAALDFGSTSGGFQDGHPGLPVYVRHDSSPAYLAADCQLVSDEGRRQLRSATPSTYVVRRTYSNYGDRCFAAAGPKLWNSLPTELQQADIIFFQRFKRLLKTFLFCSGVEIAVHCD